MRYSPTLDDKIQLSEATMFVCSLLTTLLIGLFATVCGQDMAPVNKTDNSSTDEDYRPLSDSIASIGVSAEDRIFRRITIHAEAKSELKDSNYLSRYYHRPTLTLRNRKPSTSEMPSWILSTTHKKDIEYLELGLQLSSRDFRDKCREVVVATTKEKTLESIQIIPWPIRSIVMTCRDVRDRAVLASYESPALRAVGDELRVYMTLLTDRADFLSVCREGMAELEIRYSYAGSSSEGVIAKLKGKVEVKLLVEQNLTSGQLSGDEYIFQRDVSRVTQAVTAVLEKEIVGNPDFLPNIKANEHLLAQEFFTSGGLLTFQQIENLDKARKDQIAKYLEPAQITLTESQKKTDTTVVTDQEKLNVKTNATIPIKKVQLGGEISYEDVEKIEHTYGVTFNKSKNEVSTKPKSVKIFTLIKGQHVIDLDESTSFYKPVGKRQGYSLEAPFNPNVVSTEKVKFHYDQQKFQCSVCSGQGVVICRHCKGYADHECKTCKGVGLVYRSSKEPYIGMTKCFVCKGDPASVGTIRFNDIKVYPKGRRNNQFESLVIRTCLFCQGGGHTMHPSNREVKRLELCSNSSCRRGLVLCPAAKPDNKLDADHKHGVCRQGRRTCGRCSGKGYLLSGEMEPAN